MQRQIKRIVILGGGSAGWLTAGIIAADNKKKRGGELTITLVESPDVPIIGVGEGTWPSMRDTLRRIGVGETEFFRECDASFKQGAKFAKWVTGTNDDYYYHPLVTPHGFNKSDIAAYWLANRQDESFADVVCAQSHICERGLAPKQITTPEYASVANYAYHLNSGKLGQFLQKHCTQKLGVVHILDHVKSVNSEHTGDIASLATENHGDIEGDLFIDCSGMTSLLLGQHFGIEFESKKHILFNDTALAMQVPYSSVDAPIASHTISTAQSAGWIWDIGLSTRRGVGAVYSSAHISDDDAEAELRAYVASSVGEQTANNLPARKININPGHRKTFWHRNCVAVGLSAGFIEPLEASALVLVESSAAMISDELPVSRNIMDIVAARFNKRLNYYWESIIDFLKLHYVLTKRSDTAYWRDNLAPETIPLRLAESLQLWSEHVPNQYDFPMMEEMFPAASWQYVLYGMGFKTQISLATKGSDAEQLAANYIQEARHFTGQCLRGLPTHRDLINKILQHGLQTV